METRSCRLIIAGGRDLNLGYEFIDYYIKKFKLKPTELVTGNATGIDRSGAYWAEVSEIPIRRFGPDWEKHGRSAGPLRNKKMAMYADCLLLIWTGSSLGSASMKLEMTKQNKPIYEIIIRELPWMKE